MNKKLLIVLWLFTILLAGCWTNTTEPTDQTDLTWEKIEVSKKTTTLKYENKIYRLKLDFPSTRSFKENVYWANVMFFAPKKWDTTENLWITIKLIQSWTNLDSLYEENKTVLQWISEDFKIEEEKDIKIDNFPAKQIKYAFSQWDYDIKQEQILVIKEETLYMINYTATKKTFDTHKKDVDNIIKSISIR